MTSVEMKETTIEELKIIRDRYHNKSWNAMVRHYKIQAAQKTIPTPLKEQMLADVDLIKDHIGQNPESGWKHFENAKFRLPANVCVNRLEEVLNSNEDSMPKEASMCMREIIFMVKAERKKSRDET